MRCSTWLTVALNALSVYAATTPSRTVAKRWKTDSELFVKTANGQFQVNGSEFKFIGTNAYWLPYLNSVDDINSTLANMSAAGIRVVRTWAFNDVTAIPVNGTWLQLIVNGTTSINNGTNGLQRLDKFVELAQSHGIYVLFSLTNNWNPIDNSSEVTIVRRSDQGNSSLPRNFLSNTYGGMDAYVREFGLNKQHDEFYANFTIMDIFKNYTKQVITRFIDSPAIFAWELANDPRCSSSLAASDSCNTLTITNWHANVSSFVRSIDPNHLVSSGNHGFQCPFCPKLFPLTPPAPAARPSPAPGASGARRRSVSGVMTKARLMRDIADKRRKIRLASPAAGGVKIRGRWTASGVSKRQDSGVGPAFDGSQGVDSQDILNIPDIGFGSFQLFPDQNNYNTLGTGSDNAQNTGFDFNATLQEGINWINSNAASAQAVGKPLALTGFGVVTQENSPFFVPFNSTLPSFPTAANTGNASTGTLGVGATDQQRDQAYQQWLQAGIDAGVQGLVQYQWTANNLTQQQGTLIPLGVLPVQNTNDSTGTLGQSPNDGYSVQGVGLNQEQATLSNAAQQLGVSP